MAHFRITTNGIKFRIEYGRPTETAFDLFTWKTPEPEIEWYPLQMVEGYEGVVLTYHWNLQSAQDALKLLIGNHDQFWMYREVPGTQVKV